MSLDSLRLLLQETARVVELADDIQSPLLRGALLNVIRDSLAQVSHQIPVEPQPLPTQSLPPPSPIQPTNESVRDVDVATTSSRGSTRYNVFISQVTPLLRLQNPQRHPKANMAMAAGLWRAYKHLGDEEMMAAVREDVQNMDAPESAFRSVGLRSLSIESE